MHQPVLAEEVLEHLALRPGDEVIDATADGGGHAVRLIRSIQPDGKVLLLEWDEALLQELQQRLQKECPDCSNNYIVQHANYTELANLARSLGLQRARGVLFDLGMSSFHLEASKRGFSFQKDEPLDMRYSETERETAASLLAQRTEKELESIFREGGEERFARRIARMIVAVRKKHPIRRTVDLVRIIQEAVPGWYRRSRIHFATRTFQALRIAVNHEFENIRAGLAGASEILEREGRIAIITFHSLEDHIVKEFFRNEPMRQAFARVTKKPIRPGATEIAINPRARSAKLYVFQKI